MSEMDLLEKTAHEFIRRDLGPDIQKSVARAREAGFFAADEIAGLCRILDRLAEADAGFGTLILSQYAVRKILGHAPQSLVGFGAFQNPSQESIDLVAESRGDSYAVSGEAKFVLLGSQADQLLLPAKHAGKPGFSYFLVESGSAIAASPIDGLGLRSCPVADLKISGAKANLCGSLGEGSKAFNQMSSEANLAVAALLIGVLRPSLRVALEYANQRVQGGRKILDWSAHRMGLADLLGRLKVSEAALSDALRANCEARNDAEALALATAIHLQESAGYFSARALRALGGSGYMKDFPQERYFRDAHALGQLLGSPSLKKLRLLELTLGSHG